MEKKYFNQKLGCNKNKKLVYGVKQDQFLPLLPARSGDEHLDMVLSTWAQHMRLSTDS